MGTAKGQILRLSAGAGAVVLLAVLALSAILPGTSTTQAAGPCTDVQIVGLRGSSEAMHPVEHDMGSLVGPMADAIATQGQGAATFSFYGLPYSAVEASAGNFLDGDYFDSKAEGSRMLHAYLHEQIAACPSMRFVVLGYSQGAHAAGDQLAVEPASVTDRIKAFVMFGDPRFNPDASYTWGTFDPRDYGLAGKRSTGDFSGWSNRVFSFCNQNDVVCQGVGWGHGGAAHDQAAYLGAYETLVAGIVRRRLGFPRPSNASTPLDLAFVIDSTGSMGGTIDGVTDAAANIAQTLEGNDADFRVGLVDYKDTDQGDPYAAQVDLDMTNDASAFASAVNGLTASGGGDYPEAVYSGLMRAIDDLSWRTVPRKAIIVMGDAPAKNPEPETGFTETGVLNAARALDPAVLYPVVVNGGPIEAFQPLADGSGGELFEANEPSAVAKEVVAAVDKAAVPVFTSLTVGTPARPGTPVQFSAAGSYYDPGEIVSYTWDFDGDGIADAATAENRTTHVYGEPFSGIASVTVHTDDEHSGTVTAAVEISEDAPLPPGPPQSLSAAPGQAPGALLISWQPPAQLGGGTLAGYRVEVEGLEASEPVAALGANAATTSVTIPDLPAGGYRVRVSAVTEAGTGASALATATLDAGPAPSPSGQPLSDGISPALSALSVTPRRFLAARARAAASAVGSTISFDLSEPARLAFGIARRTTGRRVGGRCKKQTPARLERPRCQRYVQRGTFPATGARGHNSIPFKGRLGRKTLTPGAYRLSAIATDPAGNTSPTKRALFRILEP